MMLLMALTAACPIPLKFHLLLNLPDDGPDINNHPVPPPPAILKGVTSPPVFCTFTVVAH